MQPPAIDYGARLKAGIIVPSGNPVAEPEIAAMLPDGVVALVTRLALRGSQEAELLAMLDGLEDAARLLSHAEVETLVFHCTAVSTFAPHLARDIAERIGKVAPGTRCFATADAILAAIARLGARRVTLLTPYNREVHGREIAYLDANGIAVADAACLEIETNSEMAALAPETLLDWASGRIGRGTDLVFLSCTALRSAGIVTALEGRCGVPVITSNQAMAWHLLRLNGIADPAPQWGRLFTLS